MKSFFIKLSKLSFLKKLGISILLAFCIYLPFEIQNMYVDYYNFGQLEKAKPILESIPENAEKFSGLELFNTLYKANITPLGNCYHVSNNNGNQKYIFGFQLKSKIYTYLYGSIYIYPKYDIPYSSMCTTGPGGGCFDRNKKSLEIIVSNPCKD